MRAHLYTALLPAMHRNLSEAQSDKLLEAYHRSRASESELAEWIRRNGGAKRLVGMTLLDLYQAGDVAFGVHPGAIECLQHDESLRIEAESAYDAAYGGVDRPSYRDDENYKAYVDYEEDVKNWI